jgi:hypothetical protein
MPNYTAGKRRRNLLILTACTVKACELRRLFVAPDITRTSKRRGAFTRPRPGRKEQLTLRSSREVVEMSYKRKERPAAPPSREVVAVVAEWQ